MAAVTWVRDGTASLVTIDRPNARNAISLDTMNELDGVLQEVAASSTSALILRGAGDRAFVSGGDLKELAALRTESEASEMALRMRHLLDTLAGLPMPTIAVVNGHAFGGGAEVAVACDLRVAADDVRIAFNKSQLAIMPAWGGLERLVQLVGRSTALDLLLSGRALSAADARGVGLFDRVVPRPGFEESWRSYVAELVDRPASVAISIKAAVDAAAANTHPHLEAEAVARFARLWAAEDHWSAVEAMTARRAAPKGS